LGEGGGVVDPVADHAHDMALALKAADLGCLVAGKDFSDHPVDARPRGDGFGGAPVVAGEHDDLEAEATQGRDGGDRVVLEGVGHGHDSCRLAVDRDEHRGLALARQW